MKQRMITGLTAALVFVLLLALGGYPYLLCILLMAIIGFGEFARLQGLKTNGPVTILGMAATAYTVIPADAFKPVAALKNALSLDAALWLILFVLFIITVASKNRIHIGHILPILVGIFYIGIGFYSMVAVRRERGFRFSLMIFGCIWMTDTGAYLCGRWFGKRKLWPAISPKKTVEGAIGGTIFSIITATMFAILGQDLLDRYAAIWFGLVIAILAQLGDLIQSAYKRHAGVKDSGQLLPGHGGVLDRCDSWLIVFPFLYYFIPIL